MPNQELLKAIKKETGCYMNEFIRLANKLISIGFWMT